LQLVEPPCEVLAARGGKSGRAVEKTHRDSVNKMAKMVRPLYGRQCLMSLVNEPQTEPNGQPKARQAS